MTRILGKPSYAKGFRTIGAPNKQEKALALAFRLLAKKVQDPKHKNRNVVKVWTEIFTETAEELEDGIDKDNE